jgi:uncharacterized protein (DUF433 family)
MSPQIADRHIEIAPDLSGGEPHIRGHRIKVRDIAVWHEQMGRSADEICAEYDLDLAEVYAALAYYFDHREEIDLAIVRHRVYVDDLRRQTPSVLERKLSPRGG